MLHFETIEPETLTVLRKLISLDALSSFSLVGELHYRYYMDTAYLKISINSQLNLLIMSRQKIH
jgi:hypothetical protein